MSSYNAKGSDKSPEWSLDPPTGLSGDDGPKKKPRNNAATGASAAGFRAITAQFVAFYFRAPMKAFFRSRVDYMAYARAINPRVQAGDSWSWRISTPALLVHAVKEHGWGFIPNQVLPPMLANVSIGAVLYTSYLQALGALHEPSSRMMRRTFPPPDPRNTFAAGFIAGGVQSLFAAPLDALQVRFRTNEMLEGRYRSMWHYAYDKLHSIGVRGVFAGWGLSFVKDTFSSAVFFCTFEYVKSQMYYGFLPTIYRHPEPGDFAAQGGPVVPHYLLEPSFILAAGVLASVGQQSIQHPIYQIQNIHYNRLESLDYAAKIEKSHSSMMRRYYAAYIKTFEQASLMAKRTGGWRKWLYKDFVWSTLRQTPSTAAGLIVFEIVRRKYAVAQDEADLFSVEGIDFKL